jgi:hypothetical protein
MRPKRILTRDAWYEVRTAVNNREPLLRRRQAIAIFCRVFGEANFGGFALVEERLSFYIRPADGLQLPAIMQWLKQTFTVRFNRCAGRTGHIWGDRYWSRVLEVDWETVEMAAETGVLSSGTCPPDGGVSPLTAESGFSPQNPARFPPPPG